MRISAFLFGSEILSNKKSPAIVLLPGWFVNCILISAKVFQR